MNTQQTDILLVEDNQDDAGLIIRALRKNDPAVSIIHLTHGEEAIEYLFCEGRFLERNIHDLPKLIILDLKMPKVDGVELLLWIKADARTRHVPVVMLTSSNQNTDIKTCYSLGANSYIVKPMEFDELVKAVAGIGQYWLQLNYTQQN